MTTRRYLVTMKSRALRAKVWFKALSRIERAIFDLTIKCVEKTQSPTLENALSNIIHKIVKTMENRFLSNVEKVGRQLAQNLSSIAQTWGNKTASNWQNNKDFILYLGINNINL